MRKNAILLRMAILSFLILALELCFQALTSVLGAGFCRVVLFCLLGAGFLTALSVMLPPKADYALVLCALAALTLFAVAQLVYYKVFYSFFTVYSMLNGGDAFQFLDVILSAIRSNLTGITLLLTPLAGLILIGRIGLWPEIKPFRFSLMIAPLLAFLSLWLALLTPLAKDPTSLRALELGQGDINSSVRVMGLFTTVQIDLLKSLVNPAASAPAAALEAAPPSEAVFSDIPSPAPEPTPTDTPVPAWFGKYNAINVDFDALLEADKDDSQLSQLHSYFSSLEPSSQNEHTGLFEGYNLIYLTCESFSHLAIDPELTPTLYKMQTEGMTFSNFYNPIWGVSTTDGEYVACLGLVPKTGVWSLYQSRENYLPFAMGNQLKSLGYKTVAYHNHSYTYYHRDQSHPNMGYEYKGLGGGLDLERTWPESDLEMMEKTVDEYIGSEPFHAYYMTVSGHLEYSFTGNAMSAKHRDAVKDLPYSDPVKAYLAAQIELDHALAYLNARLEEAGLAERTLIVMVADHYPYGLTAAELSELAGQTLDETFGIYQSGLIIYAKGMTPEQIDSPVSSLDVLPTISNLLGLSFDSRLLSGRDVFSDAQPLVFFSSRSFITEAGRYDSNTKTFTLNEGCTVPEGYREAISEVIEARCASAAKILDTDYYGRLREYLEPKS